MLKTLQNIDGNIYWGNDYRLAKKIGISNNNIRFYNAPPSPDDDDYDDTKFLVKDDNPIGFRGLSYTWLDGKLRVLINDDFSSWKIELVTLYAYYKKNNIKLPISDNQYRFEKQKIIEIEVISLWNLLGWGSSTEEFLFCLTLYNLQTKYIYHYYSMIFNTRKDFHDNPLSKIEMKILDNDENIHIANVETKLTRLPYY